MSGAGSGRTIVITDTKMRKKNKKLEYEPSIFVDTVYMQ